MDIEEIKALIRVFEGSSLSELSLQREGAQLVLKRPPHPNSAPSAGDVPPAPPAEAPVAGRGAGEHAVPSPLVGTFYRRPSPEEPPYVELGQRVQAGDTLCLIEAMKVMNEIKADRPGVVTEILVEDAAVVEYGQPLIVLQPA